jgi:4-aminobutyrate aminotransferase-like enzyme
MATGDPKQSILALNAFDPARATALAPELAQLVQRRYRLFGSASVLFYERPLEFVRAQGCWLYDAGGTAYLDAYNNVPSVGHCHPRVVAAAAAQLAQINVHSRYLHAGTLDYAERLLATLPAALANITFTCTGSESNDLALRLAAGYSGATGVIVTEAAYHGNTALTTRYLQAPSCSAARRRTCAWSLRPPHPNCSRTTSWPPSPIWSVMDCISRPC